MVKIYKQASIPTVAYTSIERKVRRLMSMKREKEVAEQEDKRTGKTRDQGGKRKKKKNNKVKVKLQDVVEEIFEVKSEVPDLEKTFYEDQCGDRKVYIGNVDEEETMRLVKEASKKKKKEELAMKEKKKLQRMKEKEEDDMKVYKRVEWSEKDEGDDEDEEGYENNDKSFKIGDDRSRTKVYHTNTEGKRKRWSQDEEEELEEYLEHCDRFKVSETATSTLFNLRGKKLKLNQSQVNKKKKKLRLKKVENFKPEEEPEAIGFDERIDQTKVEVGRGATGRKRFEMKKEEHCAVILYPGEQFAGHVVPKDHRAAHGEALSEGGLLFSPPGEVL